eukprot:CAMPEP_0115157848 /NCGR_PEP_ID=MMETSP0227-20121206/69251_1 /TAXON_ID=89957 /ORGANISM="Polarella glacialis, Strain CCMP 1383" /LENGTH=120 /DNA_ID=CAMNT_0002569227 /DNA_START=24 /DNA_END=386 /DNA_ORIENTATION=+
MEAIALTTTHWQVTRGVSTEMVGLPEAVLLLSIPAGLGINEVVLRRVRRYAALTQTPYVYGMAKAAFQHNISRMVHDAPQVVILDKVYHVPSALSFDDLKTALAVEGPLSSEHVAGKTYF